MFTAAKSSSKSRARFKRKHTGTRERDRCAMRHERIGETPTVLVSFSLPISLRFLATDALHVDHGLGHFRNGFLHFRWTSRGQDTRLIVRRRRHGSAQFHFVIFARRRSIARKIEVTTMSIVASAFTSNGLCLIIARYGEQHRSAPRRVRRLRYSSKYPFYVNRALRWSRRNKCDHDMFVREINEK